ncbi:MAG TPA: branched-chain amino acid ABC transporter substrate-binding protein [Azospirillaceae bacterium]|nr:branched-chain amino acid ABC transporter substrate-binding protein [Azospirillaceae bacterium]
MPLPTIVKRAAAALALCGALAATGVASAETITVALVGPMVGTSFSVGRQYQTGVSAAWEATGRQALGRPVEILAQDDGCNETLAGSVARKLVELRPAVVIGHSCSAATLAGAPIYADAAILQITPASTNPKVTEMGVATLFRMIGRDDRQGVAAASMLAQRYAGRRVGVVHAANAYGRGLGEIAVAEMTRLGAPPALTMIFEQSEGSFLPLVEKIITARLDALYIVGGALDVGVLLRQIRLSGGEFPVYGSDTLVSEVFRQAAESYAEGVRFTFPPEPMSLPSASQAVAAIRAKGVEPIGYTLLAYAAYETWREGVNRARTTDAAAVAAAIRGAPVDTILGPVSFDEKGDIRTATEPFVWYEWREGKRVRSTDP